MKSDYTKELQNLDIFNMTTAELRKAYRKFAPKIMGDISNAKAHNIKQYGTVKSFEALPDMRTYKHNALGKAYAKRIQAMQKIASLSSTSVKRWNAHKTSVALATGKMLGVELNEKDANGLWELFNALEERGMSDPSIKNYMASDQIIRFLSNRYKGGVIKSSSNNYDDIYQEFKAWMTGEMDEIRKTSMFGYEGD